MHLAGGGVWALGGRAWAAGLVIGGGLGVGPDGVRWLDSGLCVGRSGAEFSAQGEGADEE